MCVTSARNIKKEARNILSHRKGSPFHSTSTSTSTTSTSTSPSTHHRGADHLCHRRLGLPRGRHHGAPSTQLVLHLRRLWPRPTRRRRRVHGRVDRSDLQQVDFNAREIEGIRTDDMDDRAKDHQIHPVNPVTTCPPFHWQNCGRPPGSGGCLTLSYQTNCSLQVHHRGPTYGPQVSRLSFATPSS